MGRRAGVLVIAAAVMVTAVAIVILSSECGGSASCPATARVADRTYIVGGIQELTFDETDLVPHLQVDQTNVDEYFLDRHTYALRDVDPATFLLARTSSDLRNGETWSPAWGTFLGLWGEGRDLDLCRFFVQHTPSWCA